MWKIKSTRNLQTGWEAEAKECQTLLLIIIRYYLIIMLLSDANSLLLRKKEKQSQTDPISQRHNLLTVKQDYK